MCGCCSSSKRQCDTKQNIGNLEKKEKELENAKKELETLEKKEKDGKLTADETKKMKELKETMSTLEADIKKLKEQQAEKPKTNETAKPNSPPPASAPTQKVA